MLYEPWSAPGWFASTTRCSITTTGCLCAFSQFSETSLIRCQGILSPAFCCVLVLLNLVVRRCNCGFGNPLAIHSRSFVEAALSRNVNSAVSEVSWTASLSSLFFFVRVRSLSLNLCMCADPCNSLFKESVCRPSSLSVCLSKNLSLPLWQHEASVVLDARRFGPLALLQLL